MHGELKIYQLCHIKVKGLPAATSDTSNVYSNMDTKCLKMSIDSIESVNTTSLASKDTDT